MEQVTSNDIKNLKTTWLLPQKKIPIVIIGAGGIVSDAHLPAYQKANFEVLGIYDPDEKKSKECAEKFSIKKIYSSEAEAFQEKNVVFDIAVPPQVLLSVVKNIPENSICQLQKPMGNSMAEAKEIKILLNLKT